MIQMEYLQWIASTSPRAMLRGTATGRTGGAHPATPRGPTRSLRPQDGTITAVVPDGPPYMFEVWHFTRFVAGADTARA
jgi:hypothetical protein